MSKRAANDDIPKLNTDNKLKDVNQWQTRPTSFKYSHKKKLNTYRLSGGQAIYKSSFVIII